MNAATAVISWLWPGNGSCRRSCWRFWTACPSRPEKATYVCELYHEENWREKGLLYELSWRVAGTILDKPAGKDNGQEWGPLVELPWGSMILGHETFPVEPEFPLPHFDLDFNSVSALGAGGTG